MNDDIRNALEQFRKNNRRYALPLRYYNGDHNLAFASEKFQNTFGALFREFAMNLCPAICDALKDRLQVTGFGVSGQGGDRGASAASAAASIWRRCRMPLRSAEVHKEAILSGDAYVVVWPDETGEPAIFPHKAANMCVVYDEERPGRIISAAKYWQTRGSIRLNMFYRDRIERYVSNAASGSGLPEHNEFQPLAEQSIIDNPYDIVPVFHFGNNADLGSLGRSELAAAIPIQDGLNKSVLDMLVAMEFSAYRQRWAAGIEFEVDTDGKPIKPFNSGVEHLWITDNPNAKFGDFDAADLDQFLKVKDGFRMDMASVTGTPLYYLMPQVKGVPSGESIKKAETRFIAKVSDRQRCFGQVWSDVISFALQIAGCGDSLEISTRWEDAIQLSDRERLENILLKRRIGLPARAALQEAGYGMEEVEA